MTLVSVAGKTTNTVGTKKYWELFKLYQETSLVKALKNAIDRHLASTPHQVINAQKLGAQMLPAFDLTKYPDAMALRQESVGQLFGMVLWNHLGAKEDVWYFRRTKKPGQTRGAMVYFKEREA